MARPFGCDPRTFDAFYRAPLLGIDEVGTGALAGPICVGGVVLPKDVALLEALSHAGLRDSKKMTAHTRVGIAKLLRDHKVWTVVTFAGPRVIEEMGHGPALDHLINEVMRSFRQDFGSAGTILLDGHPKELQFTHTGIVKGDQKSLSIQAAATLAKVARDEFMIGAEDLFPGYGFLDNVGYGTRTHLRGLEKLGVCTLHRRNVKRIKAILEGAPPPVQRRFR